MKKWKYHLTHSFKDEEREHFGLTNLFQVGVYLIVNNDSSLQFNVTPNDMVKMERKLKKAEKKGEISDLQFGREITVIKDEDGFYKEIN